MRRQSATDGKFQSLRYIKLYTKLVDTKVEFSRDIGIKVLSGETLLQLNNGIVKRVPEIFWPTYVHKKYYVKVKDVDTFVIVLEERRNIQAGDKLASMSGQKGVVCRMMED